jgi:acetylornithine deacetylase/succinyl-diaminopimelate desuccinylase-like protein
VTADLALQFEKHRDRHLREWAELVSFPSISAQPERAADCRRCAEWLVARLKRMGFEARLLETPTKPVVFGERRRPGVAKSVLLYGHYDVQPPDPIDQWTTPPFSPVIRDGRMYGRGAEDNKGQLLSALAAIEALIERGALDRTVKVVIDGEEESGSAGLFQGLPSWGSQLRADVLVINDTGVAPDGSPAITMGLRGIVSAGVRLGGLLRDLHSGAHGGLAPNPALALARMIATLHGPDGRVAVEGFYDGVTEPSEQERALSQALPFDEAGYEALTGVAPTGGEAGRSPAERAWFRPTLELNAFHAGHAGPGTVTIIPAAAEARMTARLVPGQDSEACLAAILKHLKDRVPSGLELTVLRASNGGTGFRLDPGSKLVARARAVLDGLTEKTSVLRWEGGSIPVVTALVKASGAEPLLSGFADETDNAHAPNESYSIEQFRLGFLYTGALLAEL